MIYLLPFIGALISRWHGGGFFKLGKVWISLIWAVPFAYLLSIYNPCLAIPALAMCALGKSTGIGNFRDLATSTFSIKLEKLEFIILWLKPKMPEYWYDVLGLSLTGLTAVSGGLLIAPYNPLGACLIALGGLLRPIGYMIGWKVFKPEGATVFGEYVTEFIAFLPLAFLI